MKIKVKVSHKEKPDVINDSENVETGKRNSTCISEICMGPSTDQSGIKV